MPDPVKRPRRKTRPKPGDASTSDAGYSPAGRSTSRKPGGATRTKRKGKYNASGLHLDGSWFASSAEGERYRQLAAMEKSGEIDSLELQPAFPIRIHNTLVCTYRADFRYRVIDELGRELRWCIEDVKGYFTEVYVLKRKMAEAYHHIKIIEIPSRQIELWAGRLP